LQLRLYPDSRLMMGTTVAEIVNGQIIQKKFGQREKLRLSHSWTIPTFVQ